MTFTAQARSALCLLGMLLSSCGGGGPGDAGDAGSQPSGVFLDGRELSTAENVYLADGGHTLEVRREDRATFAGDFSGPGTLSITVPANSTLQLTGKQLHQASVLASGKLDLLDAGYFTGTVSVAAGNGEIQRLATPVDITSGLRAWFDAHDDTALLSDSFSRDPVTDPGSDVGVWRNKAKGWPNAIAFQAYPRRSANKTSIIIDTAAYAVKDLYLFTEVTAVVAMTPYPQTETWVGIFSTGYDQVRVPYALGGGYAGTGVGTPKVALGSYHVSEGGWSYQTEVPLIAYEPVMVAGAMTDGGSELQVNGNTVRLSPTVLMKRLEYNEIVGQSTYYIGSAWGNASRYNYIMEISELVVLAEKSSIDAISGYVAWHNGLQSKLPKDHPYKLSPPVATITAKGVVVKYTCPAGKTCKDLEQPACAPTCAENATCLTGEDCISWVCTNGTCAPPVCAPSCKVGQRCGKDGDCLSGACVGNFCVSPRCSPSCPLGNYCSNNNQCVTGSCVNDTCVAPTCAPNCPVNNKCTEAGQCASKKCSDGFCSL